MKDKLKMIIGILIGVTLTISAYHAYKAYYKAVYAKGYNTAAEATNLFIDLSNEMVEICTAFPDKCGYEIVKTVPIKEHFELIK